MGLEAKTCGPCKGGVPPMSRDEAQRWLREIPGWELNEEATQVSRSFRFGDFAQAMEFARRVGELAEDEGHHPDVALGWGYCVVSFHTHRIHGLHENDYIMAAKVNALLP